MEDLITLVGSLGFPIVSCIFLWRFINDTMATFTDVIRDNTAMLSKICDRLDMWKEEERNGSGRDKPPGNL